MNVLMSIPDALIVEVDKLVKARKEAKSKVPPLTEAQRHQGRTIAERDGAAAANAFYKSLNTQQHVKASRCGVLLELIENNKHQLVDMYPLAPHIFKHPPNTAGRAREERELAKKSTK